jgi:catechol 2,3-dioxygenase-like lactoylglutathione lyase family enzyme
VRPFVLRPAAGGRGTLICQNGRMRVIGLDHLVLNVSDVERSLAYYTGVLGLEGERVEEWRQGDVPFPSVRIDGGTIIDLFRAERDGENLNHLCLVLPRADWEEAVEQERLEVTRGPAQLFGARGVGMAFYTRDPDGNTVELRHYGD